ncbi:MAG: DUF3108 domain-containing protein [Bryobacteraceae bacterium]|jgi:hypothetical protein
MSLKPLLALLVFAPLAPPQSLPARETLSYTVEWRLITAGKVKLEWTSEQRPPAGAQVHLRVESVGLVSRFFKVEDDYSASLNSALCGQSVQMTSLEGSRQRETRVTFDSTSRKASYLERDRVKNAVIATHDIDIPPCVHDVGGGFYFLRTLNLDPGQSIEVPVSDGKKSVTAKVEAQQREDVKTPAGTFKTIRHEIYLFNNVLYRRPAHLYIWLTDDRRKLPVRVQVRMQFAIGTITLLLEKAE